MGDGDGDGDGDGGGGGMSGMDNQLEVALDKSVCKMTKCK